MLSDLVQLLRQKSVFLNISMKKFKITAAKTYILFSMYYNKLFSKLYYADLENLPIYLSF